MKPKKLPTLETVTNLFTYIPTTGKVTRKLDGNNQTKAGDIVGKPNSDGYLKVTIERKSFCLQRIVYLMYHGVDPYPFSVDHKNGNRSDNRISNLRLLTNQWNCRNLNKPEVGVSFYKALNKWVARIVTDEGRKFLGTFLKKEDALLARKKAEQQFWGKLYD